MEKLPTISIIMPLYNKEEWVSDTISSILSQTFRDFELIVVDDGSSDNSIDIVKSFEDDRIKIIKQQNKGVSSARNRGFLEAKGKFIAFVDADDIWRYRHLEYLVESFKRYPDAIFVANSIDIQKSKRVKDKDIYLDDIKFTNFSYIDSISKNIFNIHIGSVMFKRESLDNIGVFYEDISIGEDVNLLIRASCKGQAILCNYKGMVYRIIDTKGAMLSQRGVEYLPKYLKGLKRSKCQLLINLKLQKFIFNEYIKKAYQNRKYPFSISELKLRDCGEEYKAGVYSMMAYIIVRFMPTFIFKIFNKKGYIE